MAAKVVGKFLIATISVFSVSIVAQGAPTKEDASKLFSHPGVNFNPTVDMSTLSESCKTFISTTLPENNWVGGFVQVPEDWTDSSSRTINVFYYHNRIPHSVKKPIVFFNGGPFSSYQVRMLAMKKQLEQYDTKKRKSTFVMFDQRGVGCSHPSLPEKTEQIDLAQFQNYGSPSIALDAEVIRKKLFGHTPWKVFAQSYGGPIAGRYLKYFPNRISSMHLYAPAFFNSMSDFFANRIEKSQEVIKKFLAHYDDVRLTSALNRISSEEGKSICVLKDQVEKTACGHSLTDLLLTGIGQGMGRSQNGTEVWDGARQALIDLEQADFVSENESAKKFNAAAVGAGAFFHNPSIGIVFSNWSLEFPFASGDLADDCSEAYEKLEGRGLDTSTLLMDECRIITQYIPRKYRESIHQQFNRVENREFNTHASVIADMNRSAHIKIHFYVGDLDLIVQPETLKVFSKVKSVKYSSFPDAGHAGWLYKPEVWKNLLK